MISSKKAPQKLIDKTKTMSIKDKADFLKAHKEKQKVKLAKKNAIMK